MGISHDPVEMARRLDTPCDCGHRRPLRGWSAGIGSWQDKTTPEVDLAVCLFDVANSEQAIHQGVGLAITAGSCQSLRQPAHQQSDSRLAPTSMIGESDRLNS